MLTLKLYDILLQMNTNGYSESSSPIRVQFMSDDDNQWKTKQRRSMNDT
jgi:hypothetical protein